MRLLFVFCPIFFLLLLGRQPLVAQAAKLSPWVDGIYFAHAELLAGTPNLNWADIKGELVQLPDDYRLQVAAMQPKDGGALPTIYAVVLDSFPYLLVKEDSQLHYHEFAGLRLAGRYRYYSYETYEEVSSRMYAYNPLNGRPFRQGIVSRKKAVLKKEILDLATGKIIPFTQTDLADLVSTDQDLVEAILALETADPDFEAKLLQGLRLYNKRYPFIPSGF